METVVEGIREDGVAVEVEDYGNIIRLCFYSNEGLDFVRSLTRAQAKALRKKLKKALRKRWKGR